MKLYMKSIGVEENGPLHYASIKKFTLRIFKSKFLTIDQFSILFETIFALLFLNHENNRMLAKITKTQAMNVAFLADFIE